MTTQYCHVTNRKALCWIFYSYGNFLRRFLPERKTPEKTTIAAVCRYAGSIKFLTFLPLKRQVKMKSQVELIIEYMEGKAESIRKKIEHYENPIMQDVLKNSPTQQAEYSRLHARLDEIEDNLLAIKKFSQIQPAQDVNKQKKIGKGRNTEAD
jgi:hypothetical protein